MQAQSSMRVTGLRDVNVAALQAMIQQKNGVFIVWINNYQISGFSPAGEGMSSGDLATLTGLLGEGKTFDEALAAVKNSRT